MMLRLLTRWLSLVNRGFQQADNYYDTSDDPRPDGDMPSAGAVYRYCDARGHDWVSTHGPTYETNQITAERPGWVAFEVVKWTDERCRYCSEGRRDRTRVATVHIDPESDYVGTST